MTDKVLIVDDEKVERDGLQAILRKGFPELDIRQARNGADALTEARAFEPDLVLMDIKMPGMSGLEAAERLEADYPHIKIIMVTAYDTFEYARTALKIGVQDYLLKPSKASEIIETVGKVLARIHEERSEREERIQERDTLQRVLPVVEADVVTQLLYDHVHEVHLDVMIGLLGARTTREAFVMLLLLEGNTAEDRFYGSVKELFRELQCGWVGAKTGRQIPVIVFRETDRSYRSQASSLARRLLTLRGGVPGGELFVAIGGCCPSLDEIKLSYQEALISSADTAIPTRCRFYEDLPNVSEQAAEGPARQLEKRLIEQVRLGQWDDVRAAVDALISRRERLGATIMEAQQRVSEALWTVCRVLQESGMELDLPLFSSQAQDFRQLRAEAQALLERTLAAAPAHQNRLEPDAAQRIRQYIAEHSAEDITLESIAAQVRLSPFYVSKMFKEQFGVNYIDYLTACRIEKAKERMLDPDASLKEIAYAVGYHDPNYFSKVFKKQCGLSPTDYRRNMLSGKKV